MTLKVVRSYQKLIDMHVKKMYLPTHTFTYSLMLHHEARVNIIPYHKQKGLKNFTVLV